MAILTADQSNVAAQFKALQDGDTLELQGPIKDWRPIKRAFALPVTIDCTKAQPCGIYGNGVVGTNWVGGQWSDSDGAIDKNCAGTAFRMDMAARISLSGFTIVGSPTANNAIKLVGAGDGVGGADVSITDMAIKGFRTGVAIQNVRSFLVARANFLEMRNDAVDAYDVQDGVIEDIVAADFAPDGTGHPDTVQLASHPDTTRTKFLRTGNVRISRIKSTGNAQGIGCYNHKSSGMKGFGALVIEDLDLELGFPDGVYVNDCDDLALRRATVRTLAGAQYQAKIIVFDCAKLVREANGYFPYLDADGVQRGGMFEDGWVEPRLPPAPVYPDGVTQPMVDFFDARYALKAG